MTEAHANLFDFMIDLANKSNSDVKIYISHTQNNDKNPLSYEEKCQFIQDIYPKYYRYIDKNSTIRTVFEALEEITDNGYKNVILVVGGDRVKDFTKSVDPTLFNIDNFKIINYANRDSNALSATKIRKCIINNNEQDFLKYYPTNINKNKLMKYFYKLKDRLTENMDKEQKQEHEKWMQRFKRWWYMHGGINEEPEKITPDKPKKDNKIITKSKGKDKKDSEFWKKARLAAQKKDHDLADYLVVDKEGVGHLPIRKHGKVNNFLLGAAYAALTTKNPKGHPYKGPNKEIALSKLKATYRAQGLVWPEEKKKIKKQKQLARQAKRAKQKIERK